MRNAILFAAPIAAMLLAIAYPALVFGLLVGYVAYCTTRAVLSTKRELTKHLVLRG